MLDYDLDPRLSSETSLISQVRQGSLPQHIGIIMDGNGRWANARGQSRVSGHREGVKSAREVVTVCQDLGISALTLYAFSLENWKRPKSEIGFLMELFAEFFQHHCAQFLQQGVRFRAIGRLELLPSPIQVMIQELEAASQDSEGLILTLALSYGGRDEIVTAVNRIVQDTVQGHVKDELVNETRFAQYLSMADLPDPDLIIRTSGESRVSNFLLWQIAYAELYFTKTFWPDFRRHDLLLALLDFQSRDRRLGGLRQGSATVLEEQGYLALNVSGDERVYTKHQEKPSPYEGSFVASSEVIPSPWTSALVSSWLD